MPRPEIAFLITESWYFLSHRRALADACRNAGRQPVPIANLAERDRPRMADLRVVSLDMRRASRHLLRELATLWQVIAVLRRERPRILHAVGLKPVLYGSVAARLLGLNATCALAGAMERLALSPDPRRRMGQAARLRVERHFGQDKVVEQTVALDRDALGET